MLVEWLTALQELAPVAALRSARWTYAAVNAGHITGIALLFGAIVPLDLRLMGCFRQVPIRTLARVLVPVAASRPAAGHCRGLAAVLDPRRAIRRHDAVSDQDGAGRLRHRQCAAAAQGRGMGGGAEETRHMPPPRLRAAGALSIALWLSVIFCGRFVAFVE